MKKLLLSAVALVVLFTACSKDDDNNIDKDNTPPPPGKYILHIITPIDSIELTYDANNKITKEASWDLVDNSVQNSELIYENGKVTKIMYSRGGEEMRLWHSFEYNSAGKPGKINYLTFNDGKEHYDSLVYNAEGRLSASYEISRDAGIATLENKTAYIWDSKGNVIREVRLGITNGIESTDSSIINYTYDNKVNFAAQQPEVFLIEAGNPAMWLSANNFVEAVETHTTRPDWSLITTEVFTYDEDGYPIAKKEMEKLVQGGQEVSAPDEYFRYRYVKK